MSKLGEKIKDNIAGVESEPGSSKSLRMLVPALVILLVLVSALGIWWSGEPGGFIVQKSPNAKVGEVTVQTLITISETLQSKPGGYLSNDVMPPGILLDNMPAWEFGVIVQIRDMSRALRKDIGRSQSQSIEDPSLAKAEPVYNFKYTSFLLPAFEDLLDEGEGHLRNYEARLSDEDEMNAQFYARSDNLQVWLRDVETRLGSLSQRLSASVLSNRVNTDLAGDNAAAQSTGGQANIQVKTPYFEIDDVFYEARGSCWALLHLLKAIEYDFGEVLEKKNALASLQQIIRELEATQATVYSPVILSGSGFGVWANHSLVMANYISRANAAIIDLRSLLKDG